MNRKHGYIVLVLFCIFVQFLSGAAMKNDKKVSGLVFFNTSNLKQIKNFYISDIGCEMWMDQKDCIILKRGNLLIGFCQRPKAQTDGLITFFFDTKQKVDLAYKKFKEIAISDPKMNPRYPIYNFFARDPDGRMIEFQFFTGDIDWDFEKQGSKR